MDPYKVTFATWDKLAQAYQDRFMDLDLYNDTYERFCQLIGKINPRILEIGCGPGNITRYLLAKRPDFNIEAIDVSPNMIELAAENNPTASFSVMDCREIDRLSPGYDAVICGFCMPYLSNEDCVKLVKDVSRLVPQSGIFYCSTIEGEDSRSGYETGSSGDKAYVYYHQEAFLHDLFRDNGFSDIEVFRKPYKRQNGTEEIHLIFIASLKKT